METSEQIRVFASEDEYYLNAFSIFIKSTDQKEQASAWLKGFLKNVDQNGIAVDAGAGNGVLTIHLADHFEKVYAIEPNTTLHGGLSVSGENITILSETIEDASIPQECADLVFCSHVLYYIPRPKWDSILEKLLSWTKPGGTLIVALQPEDTDCMRFYKAVRGHNFPISETMRELAQNSQIQSLETQRQPSRISCQSHDDLLIVLEFLANLTPFDQNEKIPQKADLHRQASLVGYDSQTGYTLSSDQVFFIITKSKESK